MVTRVTRPLVRRAADFELQMSLLEEHRTGTIVFPVFRWSFGPGDSIRTDQLCAWPLRHLLIYADRRDVLKVISTDFYTLDEALAKVDEYGWGEPPHIDEVFRDMIETSSLFSEIIPEDTMRILDELKQKWERLIAEAT